MGNPRNRKEVFHPPPPECSHKEVKYDIGIQSTGGHHSTMWPSWLVILFLAVVLTPDPGGCQIAPQIKRCRDCKGYRTTEDPTMLQYVIDGGVTKYEKCPHSDNVRIPLRNEVICARRYLEWVGKIMTCLDGDRKCLDNTSSNKEFSKGTNEKPSTTTVNAPTTTTPVSTMKSSTESWDDNIGQSTKPTQPGTDTPSAGLVDSLTTQLDRNIENTNLAHGNGEPSDHIDKDQDSKIKNMRTTIISLIVIVLVLVAIAVGLYCRKKRANNFQPPCGGRSVKYTTAPSQDSIIDVEEKANEKIAS